MVSQVDTGEERWTREFAGADHLETPRESTLGQKAVD